MCQMSDVKCHMSCVTCHMSFFSFFFQSGQASQWKVCYQRGLPRLVFNPQMKMTYLSWHKPHMNSIGEVCDSLGTDSLTSFVRNHWATGWLRVNSTSCEGRDYNISDPLFAYTGLKVEGQQSAVISGPSAALVWITLPSSCPPSLAVPCAAGFSEKEYCPFIYSYFLLFQKMDPEKPKLLE